MKPESKKNTQKSGGPIYRVRFVFRNGKYELKKVVPIEKMNLLKSLELPKQENLVGAYLELKNEKGEVIYRTHYSDPGNFHVRVSNEDGTFSHLKSNLTEKHFEVLIPNDSSAKDLIFFNSGLGKGNCEEVFKISIAEIEKYANPKNRKK